MMIDLQPSKYVVAVSGGVDSMMLLDLLHQKPGFDLVVAHFDHGIRPDSSEDRKLVEQTAKKYGLPFFSEAAKLGTHASEAVAREARYKFLRQIQEQTGATAIVTAHHQDDVLETAVINLLRGTGRKGLSSLRSTEEIKRPLISIPKQTILMYADQRTLQWREDSTNVDESYLRNYVRRRLLPRLNSDQKSRFIGLINQAAKTNEQLDAELFRLLPVSGKSLERKEIVRLSHAEARELMAAWLRSNGLRDFDRTTLERLVVAAKTGNQGKKIDVMKKTTMCIGKTTLALEHSER